MDEYQGIDFKFVNHLIPSLWDTRPYVYACPYLIGEKRAVGKSHSFPSLFFPLSLRGKIPRPFPEVLRAPSSVTPAEGSAKGSDLHTPSTEAVLLRLWLWPSLKRGFLFMDLVGY
ncbi:hypothetical protein LIER_13772 [Lithospermum erythrorhizon]|uniref:Uncharacterized protein n=1 Tax=Lithospermum erythrorhizon TaxID=34254 RepID=A0AAV3Q1X3_LITER